MQMSSMLSKEDADGVADDQTVKYRNCDSTTVVTSHLDVFNLLPAGCNAQSGYTHEFLASSQHAGSSIASSSTSQNRHCNTGQAGAAGCCRDKCQQVILLLKPS